MINLIDNAYKYSVPNGVVQISTRLEPGVHILEISDNGIGIPDDQLHRIFERFFRNLGGFLNFWIIIYMKKISIFFKIDYINKNRKKDK